MDDARRITDQQLAELFRWLTGRWALEREFVNRGSGTGRVEFSPVDSDGHGDGATLHSREVLRFTTSALRGVAAAGTPRTYEAFREFRYHQGAAGTLRVSFWDPWRRGQTYLDIPVFEADGVLIASGSHPCGEDRYDHSWHWYPAADRFETDVAITGPRKAERVLSVAAREVPTSRQPPRPTRDKPRSPQPEQRPAPGGRGAAPARDRSPRAVRGDA